MIYIQTKCHKSSLGDWNGKCAKLVNHSGECDPKPAEYEEDSNMITVFSKEGAPIAKFDKREQGVETFTPSNEEIKDRVDRVLEESDLETK